MWLRAEGASHRDVALEPGHQGGERAQALRAGRQAPEAPATAGQLSIPLRRAPRVTHARRAGGSMDKKVGRGSDRFRLRGRNPRPGARAVRPGCRGGRRRLAHPGQGVPLRPGARHPPRLRGPPRPAGHGGGRSRHPGLPNDLHCPVTLDAARAGKHVGVREAAVPHRGGRPHDRNRRRHGVLLPAAEEPPLRPQYVRAKGLADEGASAPCSWSSSGRSISAPRAVVLGREPLRRRGFSLDMGCHSIEYARWVLGKPAVKSVTATLGTYVHGDKTRG